MSDILHLSVKDFIAAAAAKQPTPGGGSVAALIGALAASLGAMALEYTAGKKAYAAHDAEIRRALASLQHASAMLQELIEEDIAAYEAVSAMLKLPEAERQRHPDYLPAVVAAIRTPQTAAGFAINILETCAGMIEKTNKFLISDLAIAAIYAQATVHASELNVRINLPLLPNQEEAAATRKAMAELSAKADAVHAGFRVQILKQI
jgi:formiminotetrahydrofolate cyclodeaminase